MRGVHGGVHEGMHVGLHGECTGVCMGVCMGVEGRYAWASIASYHSSKAPSSKAPSSNAPSTCSYAHAPTHRLLRTGS